MSAAEAAPPAPAEIALRLDPAVCPLLRVGTIRAEPVHVADAGSSLRSDIADLGAELARRHAGQAPATIEGLAAARELYRAFGIDPTRTRPSSEALLRRVLQGKPFPEISNAVDVGNLCSLRLLLPIGLYDAGKIDGPVTLRRGVAGECYPGIRKDDVHLEGRPVLCDGRRPFGNPTSDSIYTVVTRETVSLWMTIFAPTSVTREWLGDRVREAAGLLRRHLAGAEPVRTVEAVVG